MFCWILIPNRLPHSMSLSYRWIVYKAEDAQASEFVSCFWKLVTFGSKVYDNGWKKWLEEVKIWRSLWYLITFDDIDDNCGIYGILVQKNSKNVL